MMVQVMFEIQVEESEGACSLLKHAASPTFELLALDGWDV